MSASFDDVRARYQVTPIRSCPGRYIVRGAGTLPPPRLVDEAVTAHRYEGRSRDPVHVVPLQGGGLISYEKPDSSFVHTLCDETGFARKLEQLRISAEGLARPHRSPHSV